MKSIPLRCLAAIAVGGIWLPIIAAQPPSPAAFKAFAAGRQFVDSIGAINPFLPDIIRHEKIVKALKELRAVRPEQSEAARLDEQTTAKQLRVEWKDAVDDQARNVVYKRMIDLRKLYPDGADIWDVAGEAESVVGDPFKGLVSREVSVVLDPAAAAAHQAYFKAFLPVLANEREARLQRTLDEVDHALTIIREPKSSRQERMARIREAKVLVMQKLLREAPGEERLVRRLAEIAALEAGPDAGR